MISKYKEKGRDYTVEELRSVLTSASIDMGAKGKDNKFGNGVIDISRALREIDGYGLACIVKEKTWWDKLKDKLTWMFP